MMILRKLFIFIFTTAILAALSGCMQVQLGEGDNPGVEETSAPKSESTENLIDSSLVAAASNTDSFNLSPYLIFSVNNIVDRDLRGINIELSSGDGQSLNISIDANYASTQSVAVHMPTNIIDNSIYVTITGPNGSLREMHYVPVTSCVEAKGANCNKLVVALDAIKYGEVK